MDTVKDVSHFLAEAAKSVAKSKRLAEAKKATMPFGIFEGQELRKLPLKYLVFLRDECDFIYDPLKTWVADVAAMKEKRKANIKKKIKSLL